MTKTWSVVEFVKNEPNAVYVFNYVRKSDAQDDFLDRYADFKSREEQTLISFKLEPDGTGYFETNTTICWVTESDVNSSYVPLTDEELDAPVVELQKEA